MNPYDAELLFQGSVTRLLRDAEAQGIRTHEWGIWCQVGGGTDLGKVPKIHLSVGLDELEPALLGLRELALVHGVTAKVVKDVPSAERLGSGTYGMAQVGKPLSFYPRDEAEFRHTLSVLRELTKQFSGVLPHGDVRVKGSRCLSVRREAWDRQSRPTSEQYDELHHQFPGLWTTEPPSPSLPHRYVPLGLVAIRGSGFRMRALDLEASRQLGTPQTVFIKQAVPEGERDINGVDAVSRLEYEVSMYERLEGVAGIPRYVESFSLKDGSSYLVTHFCEGDPLSSLEVGSVSEVDLAHLSYELFAQILPSFHRRGVLLGDLSDGNFVRGAEGADRKSVV